MSQSAKCEQALGSLGVVPTETAAQILHSYRHKLQRGVQGHDDLVQEQGTPPRARLAQVLHVTNGDALGTETDVDARTDAAVMGDVHIRHKMHLMALPDARREFQVLAA